MSLPLRPVPRPTRVPRRHLPRTRRHGVHLARFGVALVLALGLSACGGDADAGDDPVIADPINEDDGSAARCLPDAVDCDDTPGQAPAPAEDGDAMVPEEITIVDALPEGTPSVERASGSGEPFPLFIQQAVVDGTTIQLAFSGGETPCFVVDHTEVDENAERVVVSVFAAVPDPSADCAGQATFTQSVTVELAAPLGDRPLKDGSRTVPDNANA